MIETQIILAFSWVAVMLTYLLGDVLRIMSGDLEKMKKENFLSNASQGIWLGIAVLMVIPIVMIILSLGLDLQANRLVNLIVSGFFFLFNLVAIPTYPSWYDRFLLVVSLVFNIITFIAAWNWV